jgi:hypothetical protein
MAISRYAEQSYPYVIALAMGGACWWLKISIASPKLDSLLTSAISVTAILLGFLGTAKAMLLSFRSAKYSWLKSNKVMWKLLLGYLKSAFNSSFLACIISLFLLVLDTSKAPENITPFITPALITLYGLSIVTFYRVVSAFFSILASETN